MCPTAKYPCSAQPPSIPAVPSHQISLQCPTNEYPCSAQPQSIPAVPNCSAAQPISIPAMLNGCAQPQSIPAVPNHQISLQCPTAKYPCSAQPSSIPAVPPPSIHAMPNRKVSLQCPTAEYPCSVQPPNIPAVPNRKVSLQCPSAEYPWSAQQQSIKILAAFAVVQGIQLRGGRETLHFLCNNSFRVGMLEVNNLRVRMFKTRHRTVRGPFILNWPLCIWKGSEFLTGFMH